MILAGQRIHIAGSADPKTDESRLEYVHKLVTELATALARSGSTFVVTFEGEPHLSEREDGPSVIFDWTVAEAVHGCLMEGAANPKSANGRIVATLATTKSQSHMPAPRRYIFDDLRQANAVEVEFLEPGWTGGAVRRERLSQLGDVLIAISGGEGVEHLAKSYASKGKPVIPLDINVGSSKQDGFGGASRLFYKALAHPNEFFRVGDVYCASDLLERTRTSDCQVSQKIVAEAILRLLSALLPPRVFYVRLLNDSHPEFDSVELFFRNTVDPFVRSLGFEPKQMGVGKNEYPWMNQAIFDLLHHSSVVFADLTALRPNCFMELGYALGNKQRVIVSAKDGTDFPFDSDAFEAFIWDESKVGTQRQEELRTHWERNIGRPPLVMPRGTP